MQIEDRSNEGTTIGGCFGEIWNEVANQIGFNFTIIKAHEYGIKNAQGDWSGMIGMLHRNEADIAVADFTPTQSRSNVVDFTTVFLDSQ